MSMPGHFVKHATFVIERTYEASPARVFHAFADPVAKARWFGGPAEWGSREATMDFRVGGREISRGGPQGGPIHSFEARYQDIVQDRRIIYSYDLHLDDRRISVSLATVELAPAGTGTKLTFTEQAAFLDGYDDAGSRERGTRDLLEALAAALRLERGEA
ncbi:MAG: SRPBCC family protein [Dongiaceae bacterium]